MNVALFLSFSLYSCLSISLYFYILFILRCLKIFALHVLMLLTQCNNFSPRELHPLTITAELN